MGFSLLPVDKLTINREIQIDVRFIIRCNHGNDGVAAIKKAYIFCILIKSQDR